MQKWEYMQVMVAIDKLDSRKRGNIVLSVNGGKQYYLGEEPDVPGYLNWLGEQGWEMAGIISWGMAQEGGTLFFKRPKPQN